MVALNAFLSNASWSEELKECIDMKGPRSRHKFHALRQWECGVCQKREWASPRVTSRVCPCQGAERPTWMTLIEPSRVRPVKP